ncbi:MAG: T9SS type A sorting domain-containing protein, partial [Candidatus Cloacimonetes bacterium]|nr:T9SS type A sorting domain-containing protein [Candidatus Cloacimonadota bacterium]
PISEIIGLASNWVNKIVHKDSLIFIATQEGVSVFADNPEFPFPFLVNNYTNENVLSANNITSLQISESGYLFCGSEYGLDYVHKDSMNVFTSWKHLDTSNSQLPGNIVTSISIRNERIAIGTESGAAVFELPDINNWTIYDESILPYSGGVFPVYLDQAYTLWLGYGLWDENNLTVQDSTDIAITKITTDGDFIDWTIDDLGLLDSHIMGFKEVNNTICAYTWGEGFMFYNESIWLPNIVPNCIRANLVKDLVIDKNRILWVTNGHKGSLALSKGTKGVSSYGSQIWTNYEASQSPLRSNNIYSIAVDNRNRKWFGAWGSNSSQGWLGGISIFDDVNELWSSMTSANDLRNNTISFITMDESNRMWVCSYGGTSAGINIINENDEVIHTFDLYQPYYNDDMDPNYVFFGEEKIFFGGWLSGLRIWNDTTDPITNEDNWSKTPFSDLHAGRILGIDSKDNNSTEEIWVASSSGLFMFNSEDWFKYGTNIKKKVWLDGSWFWDEDNPNPEYWYYEGQERLYGSVPTYPTVLFVDPFGLIWIGTKDAGITVFDTSRDKFTNYTTENTPLISNTITAFAYEPLTGILHIGTNEGLNSVEIGISAENNFETELYKTIAYPNPFYPDNGDILRIENESSITMPKGNTFCNIYDLSGDLVIKLEKDIYEQFSWNGKNKAEKNCSSGIYFYIVFTSDGKISKGKIALIQ